MKKEKKKTVLSKDQAGNECGDPVAVLVTKRYEPSRASHAPPNLPQPVSPVTANLDLSKPVNFRLSSSPSPTPSHGWAVLPGCRPFCPLDFQQLLSFLFALKHFFPLSFSCEFSYLNPSDPAHKRGGWIGFPNSTVAAGQPEPTDQECQVANMVQLV